MTHRTDGFYPRSVSINTPTKAGTRKRVVKMAKLYPALAVASLAAIVAGIVALCFMVIGIPGILIALAFPRSAGMPVIKRYDEMSAKVTTFITRSGMKFAMRGMR
jgi:hypothetical protein